MNALQNRLPSADEAPEAKAPPSWLRRLGAVAFLLSALLLPALLCLLLVDEHAGHTPMWDEWERGPLLQKYAAGELTWSDLTAAHINHRILTQRLLVLAGTKWWPGDLRAEQFAIVGLLLLAAAGLTWLVHRSGAGPWARWLALFSIALLLFSPMQFQNLLWAIQFAFVFPIPMLVATALLLAPGQEPAGDSRGRGLPWWRAALAAGCCWLATYSFGHGLLTWVVALPLVAISAADSRWSGWRRGLAWGSGWAGLTALVWWRYFTDLVSMSHPAHAYFTPTGQKAPGVMSLQEFLAAPMDVIGTAVAMLGAPLARLPGLDPRPVALWLGVGLLAVFLVLKLAWLRAAPVRRRRALPFLAIGAFGCLAVLAVAASRTTVIDVTWVAVKSRYVTLATMAWIGVIGMILTLCGRCPEALRAAQSAPGSPDANPPGPMLCRHTRWLPVAAILAGVLLSHSVHQWLVGVQLMDHWRTTRLQALSALMHIEFTDSQDLRRVDADPNFLRRQAEFLIDQGWLKAGIFESMAVTNFRMRSDLNRRRAGWLMARVDDSGHLDLRGYAMLPPSGQPAHGIYVAWQAEGVPLEQAEVLAYAPVSGMPRVSLTRSDYEYSGALLPEPGASARWEAEIPLERIGPTPGALVVLALNVADMQARPLADRLSIDPTDLMPGADLVERLNVDDPEDGEDPAGPR